MYGSSFTMKARNPVISEELNTWIESVKAEYKSTTNVRVLMDARTEAVRRYNQAGFYRSPVDLVVLEKFDVQLEREIARAERDRQFEVTLAWSRNK